MIKSDQTGKRAAIGAIVAAVLCAVPPLLVVVFGAGILAYLPAWLDLVWLDFVLVPLFVVLLSIAGYRWWKVRSSKRVAG